MTDSGRQIMRSMGALGLVAILGTALLAGVHDLTAERIAEQERRVVLEQLGQVLPAEQYDNTLQDDLFFLSDELHFPGGQQVTAYRARKQGAPVAVILRFSTSSGYNGNIGLLAGIQTDGRLTGVRVTTHKETPGLGDAIEVEKSDWILAFNDRSLQNPEKNGWAVKRDGGAFDQFTGATITPRAIVNAVHAALEFFNDNREMLFEHPAISPGAEG